MQFGKDQVVVFHYRLHDADGEEMEHSHDGEPLAFLHGAQGMLDGVASAFEGKQAGDTFEVSLNAAQAYGERQENSQMRVPIKHLLTKGRLRPGMMVDINTRQGPRPAVVLKVGLKNVDVDGNHPLAGKDLVFSLEVIDVRAATDDEKRHGHAHGVDGQQGHE